MANISYFFALSLVVNNLERDKVMTSKLFEKEDRE